MFHGILCLLIFVSTVEGVGNFIKAAWSNALGACSVNTCHLTLQTDAFLLSLVAIGLVYKTYPDGCWHEHIFLPRLRPYPMASALILQTDHVCFRHISVK